MPIACSRSRQMKESAEKVLCRNGSHKITFLTPEAASVYRIPERKKQIARYSISALTSLLTHTTQTNCFVPNRPTTLRTRLPLEKHPEGAGQGQMKEHPPEEPGKVSPNTPTHTRSTDNPQPPQQDPISQHIPRIPRMEGDCRTRLFFHC